MIRPLLTQIRPTYFSVDCGMAYLIRLSDGKFAVIDSAFGEYDEPDRLYGLMCEQNLTDGLPTVAAWFFTHPHGDHVNGFVHMSDKYRDKIRVEKIYYDFPPYSVSSTTCDMPSFLRAIERFGAEKLTPARGDRITLANELFEVLYTAADFNAPFNNVNNSSLVIKAHIGKYTVMFVGDLMEASARIVLSLCSPDMLKCDLMQMAHHGYWGGCTEFFAAVDPEIVVWPMPEYRYLDMLELDHNRYFKYMDNHIRHIFVSGIEENTFDMTKPIDITIPYIPASIKADFTKKSVRSLGWACITGGNMDYTPSDLVFGGNDCTLTTRNGRTLLQMVARGQVSASEKYSFKLTLTPEKECDTLGLIFDCPTPTTPDSFKLYPLSHKAGDVLNVKLYVDRKEGIAELSVNGNVATLPLSVTEPCGIILLLKDATVRISEAVFENL